MKQERVNETGAQQYAFHDQDVTFVLNGKVAVEMLKKAMDQQNAHSDLIANTIIGRMFATNDTAGLGMLLSATLGIAKSVNVQVGVMYNCVHTYYNYKEEKHTAIGNCRVLQTDVFRSPSENVEIEYSAVKRDGTTVTTRTWVPAKSLELI